MGFISGRLQIQLIEDFLMHNLNRLICLNRDGKTSLLKELNHFFCFEMKFIQTHANCLFVIIVTHDYFTTAEIAGVFDFGRIYKQVIIGVANAAMPASTDAFYRRLVIKIQQHHTIDAIVIQ